MFRQLHCDPMPRASAAHLLHHMMACAQSQTQSQHWGVSTAFMQLVAARKRKRRLGDHQTRCPVVAVVVSVANLQWFAQGPRAYFFVRTCRETAHVRRACCQMAEQTAEQTPPGAALHQRQPRSEVWKHFDLVSPKQTKCKKCDTCLTYNASTSTMLHHLRAVHGVTTKASDAGSKGLDAFVVSTPRSTTCSFAKSQKITDLLVDWIISDMRPLGIASDAGIQRLLDFLVPGYKVPSRTHLTSLVKKRHVAARKELKGVLRTEGKFIALTTDGWTSKATEGYNTTTAHFIDSNWELRSCVLETSLFPGRHTAENIAE